MRHRPLRPAAATDGGEPVRRGFVRPHDRNAPKKAAHTIAWRWAIWSISWQDACAYDLLAAADVLIYMGELSPTFEAAAMSLRPGGLFIFSVEAAAGDRYEFSPTSRRYMHSEPYLQHIATICGFTQERFLPIVVRKELDQPVAGHLVVLRLQP